MNQVAGPFMPQQPARFGLNPAYPPGFYGGNGPAAPPPPPPSASRSNASSQGFAPAPPAGFYNGGSHHGAVAPTGGYMTHPQFAGQQQQYPYTTAPFSQSVPAQALSGTPLLPPQQQDLRQSQSASPQRYLSPDVANQARQQSPPNKHPMAAPPLPQTPATQPRVASNNNNSNSNSNNNNNNNATVPSPHTPQSSGPPSREQQKVSLLLDINVELLHEVNRLQAEGKGGLTNAQQVAQMKAQGQPAELASPEYIDVLRRVKSNIAYLMPRAQNDSHRMPKGPEQMTPPAHMPQLQPRYDRLKELFPDWSGLDHRVAHASSASPKPNGMNAAASAIAAVPTRT